MKTIEQTSKTDNDYRGWEKIYKFITTAKNYESHALAPDGTLRINNSVIKFCEEISKKKNKLMLDDKPLSA